MTAASDTDPVDEEKRKEAARTLVHATAQRLYAFRRDSARLEAGDEAAWKEIRTMSQDLVLAAGRLGLGSVVACTEAVLIVTKRFEAGERPRFNLALYLLGAIDTLGLELERLQYDGELR